MAEELHSEAVRSEVPIQMADVEDSRDVLNTGAASGDMSQGDQPVDAKDNGNNLVGNGNQSPEDSQAEGDRLETSGDMETRTEEQQMPIKENGKGIAEAIGTVQHERLSDNEQRKSADNLRAEDDRPKTDEIVEVTNESTKMSVDVGSSSKIVHANEGNGENTLSALSGTAIVKRADETETISIDRQDGNLAVSTAESEPVKRRSTPKRQLLRPPLPGSSGSKTRRRSRRDDETEICQVCGDWQDAAKMLLCDGCDEGYHIYCLNPPLAEIPEGDWFCPYCSAERSKVENSSPKRNVKGEKQRSPKGKDDGKTKKKVKAVGGKKSDATTDASSEAVGEGSTSMPLEKPKSKKSVPVPSRNAKGTTTQVVSGGPGESKLDANAEPTLVTKSAAEGKKETSEQIGSASANTKEKGAKQKKNKRPNGDVELPTEKTKKVKTVGTSPNRNASKGSSSAPTSSAPLNPMHSLTMAAAAAQHQHQPQAVQYKQPLTQQQIHHIQHLQQQQAMIAAQHHHQQQQYQHHQQMLGHHHAAPPPGYYFYGPPPPHHQHVPQGAYPPPGRPPQQQWSSFSHQPPSQHQNQRPEQSRTMSSRPPPPPPPPSQSAGKAIDKRT